MLTADQTNINLGKLTFGLPYRFNYTLKNESDKLIQIVKAVLGCGSCTKASVMKSNLAPNDSTIVDTTFTPGSTGEQAKKITIIYDEGGEEKNLVLKFQATVEK